MALGPAGRGAGRALLALVVAIGLGSFGMAGASGFAVRSLVEADVPASPAGMLLAVAGFGALVVRVVGGWRLDRAGGEATCAVIVSRWTGITPSPAGAPPSRLVRALG